MKIVREVHPQVGPLGERDAGRRSGDVQVTDPGGIGLPGLHRRRCIGNSVEKGLWGSAQELSLQDAAHPGVRMESLLHERQISASCSFDITLNDSSYEVDI